MSLKLNQGQFCYIYDDAYIHMAIAKHFVQEGVWGVTKLGFSSSSSSLLWPLLLSFFYYIIGVNEIVPLIINIFLGSTMLVMIYYFLNRYNSRPIYNFLVILCLFFLTPIPLLIFSGMEHILHIILSISFVFLASDVLSNDKTKKSKYYILIILAILLVMVRYEGLALVLIVTFLFLLKRKYQFSIYLLGFSMVPILLYGIISVLKGWFFVPNSIILKSEFLVGEINILTIKGISRIIGVISSTELSIFLLFSLSSYVLIKRLISNSNFWDFSTISISIYLFAVIFHMISEPLNWFFRHDAYIIALGIFTLSLVIYDYLRNYEFEFNKKNIMKYVVILILIFLLISPFANRTYSLVKIPEASHGIYEQQYEIGLFLNKYYTGETIAINDIGAMNYNADINCVDIFGLGSMDIATEIKTNSYKNANLSYYVEKNNVKVVIVYASIFREIPSNWIKVAEWKIPKKISCAGDTVSFYAFKPEDASILAENIRSFSNQLPKDVKITLYY